MKKSNTILEELKEISPSVAHIATTNVFTVPENYFSTFPEKILHYLKENEHLLPTTTDTPFNIPENYFSTFPEKITKIIASQEDDFSTIEKELKEVAPLLNTISKKQVYSVPENYFGTLKITKLNTNISGKETSFRKWIVYAAAAIFIGVSVVGIINFIQPNNKINIQKEFANVADEELNDFLNTNKTTSYTSSTENDDITNLFVGIETEELSFYYKEQPQTDINFINEL
ncbi:MAG: hypothetical protein KF781_02030 [Chitinophagaceae bacterium]|nr:hypothetical protein [Chitinophagaceae bacterium]MCW5904287.1 hypothetical protein [Chitinophagaceae bacterium]